MVAAAVCHLFAVGEWLRARITITGDGIPFLWLTCCILAMWMVALAWGGTRENGVIGYGTDEYKRVIRSSLALFGLLAIGAFVFSFNMPRSYVLVMLPVGTLLLLGMRLYWRRRLAKRRLVGQACSSVLVDSSLGSAHDLIAEFQRAPLAGYRVTACCVPGASKRPADLDRNLVYCDQLDDVPALVERLGIEYVAIRTSAGLGSSMVQQLSWNLQETDAELIVAPELTNVAGPRIHTQPVAGLPLLHVRRPTFGNARGVLKRSFDVTVASMALIVSSPIFLMTALAVALTSPGGVFYRQRRVGLGGDQFTMVKFRSMVDGAHDQWEQLREEAGREDGDPRVKIQGDARITKVGRFIRRYSIDELPQLFNVIKGDMSLVGPRPPLSAEVELYGQEAHRRLLVKPGMTGLWQVSGRSEVAWDEAVRMDLYYVENWSLTADLVILWKTVRAVLRPSGAY